jgi:hypothetical protein
MFATGPDQRPVAFDEQLAGPAAYRAVPGLQLDQVEEFQIAAAVQFILRQRARARHRDPNVVRAIYLRIASVNSG